MGSTEATGRQQARKRDLNCSVVAFANGLARVIFRQLSALSLTTKLAGDWPGLAVFGTAAFELTCGSESKLM
jgi:hypothetical protein